MADEQQALSVDPEAVRRAVLATLEESAPRSAEISVALVDDPTIHHLNREYLNHDYPTDVLSFPLTEGGDHLAGEVVISTDTAIENARHFGRTPVEETLLYVVHGTLHLIGHDDKDPDAARDMRAAEARVLGRLTDGKETPDR